MSTDTCISHGEGKFRNLPFLCNFGLLNFCQINQQQFEEESQNRLSEMYMILKRLISGEIVEEEEESDWEKER